MRGKSLVIGCDVSAYFSNFRFYDGERQVEYAKLKIKHNTEGFRELDQVFEKTKKRRKFEEIVLVIEQTGIYSLPVIKWAWERGIKIVIVEGKDLYNYRKLKKNGVKNDWIDAELLAKYYIEGNKHYVLEIEPNHLYELKILVRYRERLVKDKVRKKNYIKQLVTILYPDMTKYKNGQFWTKVKALQLETSPYGFSSSKLFKILIYEIDQLKQIEEQIKKVEREIEDVLRNCKKFKEQVDIIKQIGLSTIMAGYLISVFWDIKRFRSIKAFRRYMGYGFKNYQSGKRRYEKHEFMERLTKKVLFMFVLQAIRSNSNYRHIKEKYEYYRSKGDGGRKAIYKVSSKVVNWIYKSLQVGGFKYETVRTGTD